MAVSPPAHTTTDPVLMSQKYLKDFLDLAVRRKWLILSFVLLGTTIGGILAWLQVDMYRSETVILIEQQKIPEKYVSSVVGGSTAERVSTMTQLVLSRTNLEKIIDEFHLYPRAIKDKGYEEVVAGLRKNIKIQTRGGGEVEAFTISFSHSDPMMAMRVTAKLSSQYMDENIKIREQFIEGAMEFLDQELVLAKEALDQKEKALSEYKLRNLGELPGQLDVNLRTLDRLQLEKIQVQESINSINSRLDLLQKAIHDYEAMGGAFMDFENASLYAPSNVEDVSFRDPLERRIAELKKELTKLSGEYTAEYPDVISLKTQIKNLEKELKQKSPETTAPKSPILKNDSLSIEKDKSVFDPYLNELKGSHEELKSQSITLRARLKKISEDMKIYESRIEATPHHEQELLALERDYDNMQKHYQRLHENRINAKISENLDKRQKGERFRILDPAHLPTKPEGFPRELIAVGGFGIGTGLGFGLAFLLDLLSPTFRRSEDAEVSLGLTMLATIPSFHMAYGKSMKMVATEMEAQKGANGKHLAFSQSVDSLLKSHGTNDVVQKLPGRFSGTHPEAFSPQLNLVAKWRPQSIVAEQYRVAATRLGLLEPSVSHRVVLITSAMQGEGKTSTSANIGYTLARDLDEPTLVIDCDFKCPNFANTLGLSHEPGLAEYFAGVEPLEACLQRMPDVPLWCMPVGNVSRYPVPFSKLQDLSNILEVMKSRYRFIILDGPPVLPLADINVLSKLADILLMVVRSGGTPKDVVLKALEMIHHTGPTRLVLTDAWTQGVPYYVRKVYTPPYLLGSKS
ncbi:MAG: AAA family ATPase [Nitrospirales bacterium]|nr:AAA family ATPase [Nitrospira sp.]MDR4459417.1 AAA family ATPase [Nitrospirales bacterium]MDR4483508.1 AAA family ATPase [Nitrospirales bacterium]